MKKRVDRNYLKAMDRMAKESGFESCKEKEVNVADKDFRQIFLGEDCEPIGARLFVELLKSGVDENELKFFVSHGFQYCRPRNSFLCADSEDGSVCEIGKKVQIHALVI